MSAATSPGNGFGLRPPAGLCGLGFPFLDYAMKSRQQATAERPPAKRRGPKPSLGRGLLHRGTWRLRGTVWLGFGSVVASCFPQAGAPVMRENTCSRPIVPPEIPMSVRSSPMPPTSCGARTAFGCSRWTTAGAGYSPPSSIGTPSASAGMCASEATASPPFSRMGREAVCLNLRRCGAGALADGSRLPVSVETTSLTRSSSGSSRPTPSSIQPQITASPRGSFARSRNRSSMAHLPQHRGAAERRPRVRRTVQCPVDRGQERLPVLRSSSSGVAHRDVTQARRMRQTCVQGTGCDTRPVSAIPRCGNRRWVGWRCRRSGSRWSPRR